MVASCGIVTSRGGSRLWWVGRSSLEVLRYLLIVVSSGAWRGLGRCGSGRFVTSKYPKRSTGERPSRSGTEGGVGGLLHPSVEGVMGVKLLFDFRDGLADEKCEPLGLPGLEEVREEVSESPLCGALVVRKDGKEGLACGCELICPSEEEASSCKGSRGTDAMVVLFEG